MLKVCAIVLSAGRSVRMGTQKLLLPIRGKPMIARIVAEVFSSKVQELIVVVGADGKAIQQAVGEHFLSPRKNGNEPPSVSGCLRFVTNPDPAGDMLSSVRCGLRETPAGCDAALVVLGDQPGISAMLINRLITAFDPNKRCIVVPVYQGRRGHPLLFSTRFTEQVLREFDGTGLHGLLQTHAAEIVEVASEMAMRDVDTPADYRREVEEKR